MIQEIPYRDINNKVIVVSMSAYTHTRVRDFLSVSFLVFESER